MAKSLNGRLGLPILINSTKMLVVVQVDKDRILKVNGGKLIIKSSLSSLGTNQLRVTADSLLALDNSHMGQIGKRMSKIAIISDWLLLLEAKKEVPASMAQISPNLRTWRSLTG